MHLVNSINLKLFIPASLLSTLGLCVFLNSWAEVAVVFSLYIVTISWLLSIMVLIGGLLLGIGQGENHKPDWFKAFVFLSLKFFVFAGALYIGRHFMGNRLFIPLLNLPIQTIVLSVSARNSFRD